MTTIEMIPTTIFNLLALEARLKDVPELVAVFPFVVFVKITVGDFYQNCRDNDRNDSNYHNPLLFLNITPR